jgi:hypothetical protein
MPIPRADLRVRNGAAPAVHIMRRRALPHGPPGRLFGARASAHCRNRRGWAARLRAGGRRGVSATGDGARGARVPVSTVRGGRQGDKVSSLPAALSCLQASVRG